MIKKIKLINFQSHQNTKLEFVPGVNSIIGQSDSGKTAILRALNWCRYNRPSGTAFISHGQNQSEVTIENDAGILKRVKSDKINSYEINNTVLHNVKTDVPEEVKKFFNLGEVNIQRQLDGPFLLSQSPGEISRFFNRIVKLDEIDVLLSAVDKKKRKEKTLLEVNKKSKIELEENLQKLNWVDKAEELLKQAENINNKLEKIKIKLKSLQSSLTNYNVIQEKLNSFDNLINLEKKVEEFVKLNDEIKKTQQKIDILNKTYVNYTLLNNKINLHVKLLEVDLLTNKVIKFYNRLTNIKRIVKKLENSVMEINSYKNKIDNLILIISKNEQLLPEVCPTCNGSGRLK